MLMEEQEALRPHFLNLDVYSQFIKNKLNRKTKLKHNNKKKIKNLKQI